MMEKIFKVILEWDDEKSLCCDGTRTSGMRYPRQ